MRILSKTVFNTIFVIGCDGDLYSIKIYHRGRYHERSPWKVPWKVTAEGHHGRYCGRLPRKVPRKVTAEGTAEGYRLRYRRRSPREGTAEG